MGARSRRRSRRPHAARRPLEAEKGKDSRSKPGEVSLSEANAAELFKRPGFEQELDYKLIQRQY